MAKILIIEDNLELREATVEFLNLEGYEVIEAAGGEKGVELAKLNIPDLILCDIMMPDYNGYMVQKDLKTDQKTSQIPFIFLTALTDEEYIRKSLELGVDDFLIKPISLNNLRNAIVLKIENENRCKNSV